MRTFGLIGFPLEHSFSETYFAEKFFREGIHECEYRNFPLQSIAEFSQLIQSEKNLFGLNVTIPYKESVIPFLDVLDPLAQEINAVNCVRIINGKTKGFNTDVFGFEESLKMVLQKHHDRALILGSGGGSNAVQHVLRKLRIEFKIVSRNPSENALSYDALNEIIISENKLIINTTPVGQFPDTHKSPAIHYQYISNAHLLFDLIYNPELTTFLLEGRKRGAQIKNGLEMLYLQGEKSWEIWND